MLKCLPILVCNEIRMDISRKGDVRQWEKMSNRVIFRKRIFNNNFGEVLFLGNLWKSHLGLCLRNQLFAKMCIAWDKPLWTSIFYPRRHASKFFSKRWKGLMRRRNWRYWLPLTTVKAAKDRRRYLWRPCCARTWWGCRYECSWMPRKICE